MVTKPYIIVRADVEPTKKDMITRGKKYVAFGVTPYLGIDGIQRISGNIITDSGHELFILISGYAEPCAMLGADWTIVD